MSGLPCCSIEFPSCGACGGSTSHDGDSFYCEDCGLDYGSGDDGEEATFRDEEEPACGKACDNSWHPTLGLSCEPCKLPASHKSDCWTDCKL